MSEIANYRKRIDEIDDQILEALCERVKVCKAIGEEKKAQGLPVQDKSRELDIYKRVKKKSAILCLDAGQTVAIYREIVNMCSVVQKQKHSVGEATNAV